MDKIRQLLRARCLDLIFKTKLCESNLPMAQPLIRYILSIPYAVPISHIILAERPYYTDIFPYAASAMSYDQSLQEEVTPIVHYLSLDISNASDLGYYVCVNWFRDSWKYLRHGIVLLNVCITHLFMVNESEVERVAIEEFIRDIIVISHMLSDRKIHIVPLGNPARHSANRIKSSISVNKDKIAIHKCDNPAKYKHNDAGKLNNGDKMSPMFTMGFKSVTRLFVTLIESTIKSNNICTNSDYTKMSNGDEDSKAFVSTATNLQNNFMDIARYFKSNVGPTVENNAELFERAGDAMREFILQLNKQIVKAKFNDSREPRGGSKPAYFSNRPDYNKSTFKKGTTSSRASAHTQNSSQKISIGFGDDDEDTPQSSTPNINISVPTPIAEHFEPDKSETTALVEDDKPETVTLVKADRTSKSVSGVSVVSKVFNVGFGDDSDEDSGNMLAVSKDFEESLNDSELKDLSFISDFIDPANDNYAVDPTVIEFIQAAVRNKKASSEISRELVTIIRNTYKPGARSIVNALGYDDDIQDVGSEIIQWILTKVIRS